MNQLLKKIFSPAIDGGCSNAYRQVIAEMMRLPIEAQRMSFTLKQLYEALSPLSKKWEKEINDVIEHPRDMKN